MNQVERAERTMSILMRLGVSAVLPAWALAMLVLGVEYRSLWWLGTGIVVGAIGVLMLAGSPLVDLFFREQ
jgi:hypothetical protein